MAPSNSSQHSLDLEHQTLFTCLAEVLKSARPPGAAAEHAAWKKALGSRVQRLDHLLTEHFRSEEAPGGLYDRLQVEHPDCSAQLSDLIVEHAVLSRRLSEVRQRFEDDHGAARNLELELEGFLAALERHEWREAALVHGLDGGTREGSRPADLP